MKKSEDEVKTDDQVRSLEFTATNFQTSDNKTDANMDDKTNDVSVEGRNSNVLNMQQEEEQKRDTNDCVEQTRESTPSRPPGFEDIPIDTYVSLNSKVKSILRTSYSASSDKNQSCDSLGGKSHVSDSYSQNINDERYIKVGLKLGHDFNGCQQALNATGRMGEMNMSMNILSINVCGIGDIVKRRRIANICSRHNVSFLDASKKRDLWHTLSMFMYHNEGNYIIFGDFNTVREESERRGYEPGFSDILSVAWEHTPHGHTLKAIHFKNKLKGLKGHLCSWWSGHLKSQILSKQDLLEKLKVIDHLIDLGIATSSDIEDRN
ncbi:RNA-directed DNA polymerase, eukaryota [Tanacetum coccineum]